MVYDQEQVEVAQLGELKSSLAAVVAVERVQESGPDGSSVDVACQPLPHTTVDDLHKRLQATTFHHWFTGDNTKIQIRLFKHKLTFQRTRILMGLLTLCVAVTVLLWVVLSGRQ